MKIDIGTLLDKINGRLDQDENLMVENWLLADEKHRVYFEKLKMHSSQQHTAKLSDEDVEINRQRFINRLQHENHKRENRLRSKILIATTVAASLILFIIGIKQFSKEQTIESASSSTFAESINNQIDTEQEKTLPIEKRHKISNKQVRLITAKGEELSLDEIESGKSLESQAFELANDKKGLTYTKSDSKEEIQKLNTLLVDRGAEFRITLCDGTTVHLNSDTKLEYPTAFNEKERKVYLQGEAYFEVAKDKSKPFIVCSGSTEIRVLGTEFNVNSRKPEAITTTLVSGSVAIKSENTETVQLKPGFTATINPIKGSLEIDDKDIQCYIGWMTGNYLFESTPLSDILNELAIWYDLKIDYQTNRANTEIFTGSLSRNLSIDKLIQLIERTNYLDLELKNKTIVVKEWNS